MTFPMDSLIEKYFDGGANLVQGSAGLAALLNNIRTWLNATGYHVDPDNPKFYANIDDAFEALDEELPAGVQGLITLAPGHTYAPALTLDGSRNVAIITHPFRGTIYEGDTILGGTITLSPFVGDRATLTISGVQLAAAIAEGSNWRVSLQNGLSNGVVITRTHGADNAQVDMLRFNSNDQSLRLIDTDAGGFGKAFYAKECFLSVSHTTMFTYVGHAGLQLHNCTVQLNAFGLPTTFLDLGVAVPTAGVQFYKTLFICLDIAGGCTLLKNHTNADFSWSGSKIAQQLGSLDMGGNVGTHVLSPSVEGLLAPTNPIAGTGWRDTTAFANKIWNGGAWV